MVRLQFFSLGKSLQSATLRGFPAVAVVPLVVPVGAFAMTRLL
jgi:hypothetical protein